MNKKAVGPGGLILSILLLGAFSTFAFFYLSPSKIEGDLGLCLDSPNVWNLTPIASLLVNLGLILAVAFGMQMLNRRYNFIRLNDYTTISIYLTLTACNPWITQWVGSSTLLVIANLVCWRLLFDCYRARNATQQVFIVASILSFGSMVQYSFLFMIPIYFIAIIILSAMHWREFLAMMMGLIAPYWIVLGLGIVSADSFKMPEITNLFTNFAPPLELLLMLIGLGLAMLMALIVGFNNEMRLFAGNSRILALNNVITLTGIGCAALIIIDFNNMLAYIGTFYLSVAVQGGNLFALHQIRNPQYLLAPLMIIYIAIYGLIVWPF